MIYYRICFEDLGDSVVIHPSIPKHPAKDEDKVIPRICVAPTIYQCIKALELTNFITKDTPSIKVYVYLTSINNLNISTLYYPTSVPDAWITGEMWIKDSCLFRKAFTATIRKQMEIPNTGYSRYSFVRDGCEEVPDRYCATSIYGTEDSFSFIELDNDRIEYALQYASENIIDTDYNPFTVFMDGIKNLNKKVDEAVTIITKAIDNNSKNNNEVINEDSV